MAFNVAFRLDAGAEIGLGHLMRCLAIADRLRAAGAECHFLCHNLLDQTLASPYVLFSLAAE